ncbi:cardiolipin synthase [Aliidiomarina soli]|uniref:Cardiolipin synthase n=1 Tax=Aliidiomarina soli TaxID=1928574 RepID=A0A432WMG4_9GAMM|nr:cardiolipin synthase [Aliidiomarina soli]RUO34948.1 cardiolipin synthase [Aliidiomarina soli]
MISSDLLFILYWLFIASVTLRVIFKRQSMSASLAWLLIIYIVPLIGAFAYFFFGEMQLGQRRAEKSESMREPYMNALKSMTEKMHDDSDTLPDSSLSKAIQQLLIKRLGVGVLNYHDFTLLNSPQAIFASLRTDIENAQRTIDLEFYIWHSKGQVNEIETALIKAAQRGVEVRILADDAGSWPFFFSKGHKAMKEAGIHIVPALPVSPWRLALRRADIRLHRKIIVIDHQIAYTGSMNMADPTEFNKNANVGQWIDAMARFRGAAAVGMAKVFAWDWEVETEEHLPTSIDVEKHVSQQWLATIPSGPGLGHDLITEVMLSAIYRADTSITICTPYFVPPEPVFEALLQALARGVKMTILVPRRNDSRLVSWASRAFYDDLLQAGAEIRNYHGGLLHTKALLIDDQLAIFGSVNLDARSLQVNFEISLALFHPSSCKAICDLVASYIEDSETICPERWHKRSIFSRFRERLVFFLSPLL